MIGLADLRPIGLFDGLSDDQLTELASAGVEVTMEPGDIVFVEGEHADFWWVLVAGSLQLFRHVGREDVRVGAMDVPGRWSGGFRAWDEHGVYLATGRCDEPGRLLRVPAAALRERFTAWFPFGVHLVAGLYGTARSIESTARQRDSLVTLGKLAAGLAHEINNPAAAAVRGVGALAGESQATLRSLAELAEGGITAEGLSALQALREELAGSSSVVDLATGSTEPGRASAAFTSAASGGDPLVRADREDALGGWLADRGVSRGWEIAGTLVDAGADEAWCDRVGEVLDDETFAAGVHWVAATLAVDTILSELGAATRRITELVAAMRSYSQMDRSARQLVDVVGGIESSLVMMGHRLRESITVVRDYGRDLPRIEAFPGELNQVWTNLIDNAVDAMSGAGTLRVSIRAEDQNLVVEIADTGHGMPAEVADRAFEAFYTTKEAGKGTGLGLDIAQRIVVERHGGSIAIDSRPGDTVVRVRLPVRSGANTSRSARLG